MRDGENTTLVRPQMLTAEKLSKVNKLLEQYKMTIDSIDALIEDEPNVQPRSIRDVELNKMRNELEDHVILIHDLWS